MHRALSGLVLLWLLTPSAAALGADKPRVLRPTGAGDTDAFGATMVVDGERIFVCTLRNVGSARQRGEVALLDRRTGALSMTLRNPHTNEDDNSDGFGAILAARGDRVAVSGEIEDYEGVVYVYEVPSGKLVRTLRAPESEAYSRSRNGFGSGLAFGDGVLAVGAAAGDVYATPAGIFLFDLDTGELRRRIPPPADHQSGETFGWHLAIVGGRLAVGVSPQEGPGRVLVYDMATGNLERTIRDAGGSNLFGPNLHALGGDLLVGTPAKDDKGSGVVQRMSLETGALVRTYALPPGRPQGNFGALAAVNDRFLLVVDPDWRDLRGVVWLVDHRRGKVVRTWSRSPAMQFDSFGSNGALTSDTAYVFARGLYSQLFAYPLPK